VLRSLAFKAVRWTLIALITPLVMFALSGWIGSSLPRNADWQEPEPERGNIPIMIGSNGVHTEIVMPRVTQEMDWETLFPLSDLRDPGGPYTHVAVSWGERAFFLETPRWRDMNPVSAVRALIGAPGLLHVAHYNHPAYSDSYRVIHLRPEEYRILAQGIADQLAANPETLPGYGAHDAFYSARGTYHIGYTCNQWTSDQLAAAGVRVGAWTPFPGGVMKWVPQ